MRDGITTGLLECSLPAPRGEQSGSRCKLTLDGYGFGVDFVAKPRGGGSAIYLTVAPLQRQWAAWFQVQVWGLVLDGERRCVTVTLLKGVVQGTAE